MPATFSLTYLIRVPAIIGLMAGAFMLNAPAEVLFQGTPISGPFSINFAEATDMGLEVDTMTKEGPWGAFLISDPAQISFSPLKRYRIGYDYKVQNLKSDETVFYHFLNIPNSDETTMRGETFWSAKGGETGRKEFILTIREFDNYSLNIGVYGGGAITIKNLKIEEIPKPRLRKGFIYLSPIENDERLVFNKSGQVTRKGFGVTTKSERWQEILKTSSSEIPFEVGHRYRISYTYRVKNAKTARLNHCISAGPNRTGWDSWPIRSGEFQRKEFEIDITKPESFFRVGSYGKCSIIIDDLEIQDLTRN